MTRTATQAPIITSGVASALVTKPTPTEEPRLQPRTRGRGFGIRRSPPSARRKGYENLLIDSGLILLKYWFSVSDQELERRFHIRLTDPLKQWKLS